MNGSIFFEKKIRKVNAVENHVLQNFQISSPSQSHKYLTYGNVDCKKLVWKKSIWDLFMETFDLLSAGQFENLVFRPRSQGGQILDLWPTGWRSHLDQQMLIFYCEYWCLSSRPLVSFRRDESKCHYVLVFSNQNERRVGTRTFQGPLARPVEPLIASSFWGTR